jgi:glycosyltransferase involved in cell wall biosynthesis
MFDSAWRSHPRRAEDRYLLSFAIFLVLSKKIPCLIIDKDNQENETFGPSLSNDILKHMEDVSEVTLGILVFNQAPYIQDLFNSVSSQNLLPKRIVIVDNASTDASLKELERGVQDLGLKNITKLVSNEFNTGSAAGLRQLLELSSTKYLAVVHGDDILSDNYIRVIGQTVVKKPKVRAFNVTLLAFASEIRTELPKSLYSPLWTNFRWLNPGVMPGSVLDRDFILRNKLLDFDEKINGVEDTLLWIRIIRAGGQIQAIPEALYKYRIHQSQFSFDDQRNSYFFGLARRVNISEASGFLERILAASEISYEVKRFGKDSEYIKGLQTSYFAEFNKFKYLRIINVMIRRLATLLITLNYR